MLKTEPTALQDVVDAGRDGVEREEEGRPSLSTPPSLRLWAPIPLSKILDDELPGPACPGIT